MEWRRRRFVPVACGTSERIANTNPASIVRCGPTLSKIGVITGDRATDELEAVGIGVRGLRHCRLNCYGERGRTDQRYENDSLHFVLPPLAPPHHSTKSRPVRVSRLPPMSRYVLGKGGPVCLQGPKTLMASAGSSAASNRVLAERGVRRVSSPLRDSCGAAGNSCFYNAIANHQ
jgi:hypothetical protein